MKKILLLIIAISSLFAASCSNNTSSELNINTSSTTETSNATSNENEEKISMIYILINNNKLEITLANNSSVVALIELLKMEDITYTADDYGGFEKVGDIGHSLPQNNTSISTEPGDVILYQGRSICLYYGNNSWSFTRIGKINGYTKEELKNLLGVGKGEVEVTLSLD